MYDGDATLLYEIIENDQLVEKAVETYAKEKSVTRQEFLTAYQTGTDSVYVFEVSSEDYELTRHVDQETKKPSYASKIKIEDAIYDIKRHYGVGHQRVQLTCS
jgi:hypothetical protein